MDESPGFLTLQTDPALPQYRALIDALDSYLGALYPAESNHLLDIDSLKQANVIFIGLENNGQAIGCGACVMYDDYVEIKRVYVKPDWRGHKLSRRVMNALEAHAWAQGHRLARLETGIAQPEALALYQSGGYRPCAPFGEYRADPLSVFMEKQLSPT